MEIYDFINFKIMKTNFKCLFYKQVFRNLLYLALSAINTSKIIFLK